MFIINKNKLKIEYLMIYNFLFPTKPNTTKTSLLLLAVRIIFGVLLMNHGI
jgi:putative oxidoreductase